MLMRKAFLFVETDSTVEPSPGSELTDTANIILLRGVVVITPAMIGSGVILWDTIITSLFLVGNFSKVSILLSRGKKMPAFVTGRDEKNNLAKLRPACIESRDSPSNTFGTLARELMPHKLDEAGPRAIGDPLLVLNSKTGIPKVKVAAMFYNVWVGTRWENAWEIDSGAPRGLMGSGIWNEDGKFAGVSLATRIPTPMYLRETAAKAIAGKSSDKVVPPRYISSHPVYASPAKAVLDFVETK